MGYGFYDYRPYVSVAQRRANAQREMAELRKQGKNIQPISIAGRKIAKTFWGEAWCDHLESFSDYSNRLPRGRTYVRNGSVCHLAISQGKVEAIVSGSDLYNVEVNIETLPKKKWATLKSQCIGQIGSLLELLSGKLSESVMDVVTDRKQGLFPLPGEIEFACDCPDWAYMCKHVAAVLYGVGSRLDDEPGLLFELRGTAVEELIQVDAEQALDSSLKTAGGKKLAGDDLADIFGIEMAEPEASTAKKPKRKTAKSRSASASKTAKRKSAKKRSTKKKKAVPAKKSANAKSAAAKKSTKTKSAAATKSAKAKSAPAKKKSAKRKTTKKSAGRKKAK